MSAKFKIRGRRASARRGGVNSNHGGCRESLNTYLHVSLFSIRRGKFLKRLWCCVSGAYNEIIWFYHWITELATVKRFESWHFERLPRSKSEGFTLETSAFDLQFTLSIQLIKPNYPYFRVWYFREFNLIHPAMFSDISEYFLLTVCRWHTLFNSSVN